MKHNAQQAMVHISNALKLCIDFSMAPARAHLNAALVELTKVANKREKREVNRVQLEKTMRERQAQEQERRRKWLETQKPEMNTNVEDKKQGS